MHLSQNRYSRSSILSVTTCDHEKSGLMNMNRWAKHTQFHIKTKISGRIINVVLKRLKIGLQMQQQK